MKPEADSIEQPGISDIEKILEGVITEEMAKAYLVETEGHPSDAEERHFFNHEAGKEYREMLVKRAASQLGEMMVKEVEKYEDDLLSTIDDISNKPWRAARHIRELYEKNESGLGDWYKEVADDWGLLEEFFSNGGMNTVRELMADPKFNVNYPERITQLKSKLEDNNVN